MEAPSPNLELPALNIPSLVMDNSTAATAMRSPEADALIEQQIRGRTLEAQASPLFGSTLSHFLLQSEDDLSHSIDILKQLRSAHQSISNAEQVLATAISNDTDQLSRRLGIPLSVPDFTPDNARRLQAILAAARLYKSDMDDVSEWLHSLHPPVALSYLKELPSRIAFHDAKARANERFVASSLLYFRSKRHSSSDVRWLESLSTDELLALLTDPAFNNWSTPTAILLRLGIDKRSASFVRDVSNWLTSIDDAERRRDAIRFLDPASSAYDADVRLRRIIIVERLREIISTGPLASITDQSIGMADTSLVGRTVAAIVSLLSANLDTIQSASDITSLLSTARPRTYVADRLVRFIKTPASLTGHFRRLRELARDLLLQPLLVTNGIDLPGARQLVSRIENGTAQELVIRAFHEFDGNTRLDTRHETQLTRYLKNAKELLKQTVQADENRPVARTALISKELRQLVSSMATTGAIGDEDWVEAELRAILEDPLAPVSNPTLLGHQQDATESRWTLDDTIWARSELNSALFFESNHTIVEICADSLRCVANDKAPSAQELADELIDRGHFTAALELLKSRSADQAAIKSLRARIDDTIAPRVETINAQLGELTAEYGSVQDSQYFQILTTSLRTRDIVGAEDALELLIIELADMRITAEKAVIASRDQATIAQLQKRLLDAGIFPRENASIPELEELWRTEFAKRAANRLHLSATIAIFNDFDEKPLAFGSFIAILHAFKAKIEDPKAWLSSQRSTALTEFLQSSTTRLTSWAGSAHFFPSRMQRALAIVFESHLKFVLDQVDTVESLETDSNIEDIFERVFEYAESIRTATDPAACVPALRELGLVRADFNLDVLIEPTTTTLTANEISLRLREALATNSWKSAEALAHQARSIASDDAVKRYDEVSDFARMMIALDAELSPPADLLEAAAGCLGTAGHPVNRALPTRSHIPLAMRFIECALELDNPTIREKRVGPRSVESLAELFTDVFKSINDTGRFAVVSKILEQLLSSSLASDLSERIWSFATGHQEQGPYRAEFLRFLNEHGCDDALLRLAARFDPPIKTKLERLLELRAAALYRPELFPAANALAEQAASISKSAPFRTFVKRLPSIGQAVETAIDARIDDELVLRDNGFGAPPTIHVPLLITPRGMVPEQLQAQLSTEDDVVFAGKNARVLTLTDELMYAPTPFSFDVQLGDSWREKLGKVDNARFRLRLSARLITQEIVTCDVECLFRRVTRDQFQGPRIDNESILEFYPGVGNTPAEGNHFIGRSLEIEQLAQLPRERSTADPRAIDWDATHRKDVSAVRLSSTPLYSGKHAGSFNLPVDCRAAERLPLK